MVSGFSLNELELTFGKWGKTTTLRRGPGGGLWWDRRWGRLHLGFRPSRATSAADMSILETGLWSQAGTGLGQPPGNGGPLQTVLLGWAGWDGGACDGLQRRKLQTPDPHHVRKSQLEKGRCHLLVSRPSFPFLPLGTACRAGAGTWGCSRSCSGLQIHLREEHTAGPHGQTLGYREEQ